MLGRKVPKELGLLTQSEFLSNSKPTKFKMVVVKFPLSVVANKSESRNFVDLF